MKSMKWKCQVCGFIHDGDQAPTAPCPKCKATADQFTLLDDKAAELVERSRQTNALHCRLISLARDIERVCQEGIADNLDPGCVNVFQQAMTHSWEMMKLSMTEIQGHVSKGKWG